MSTSKLSGSLEGVSGLTKMIALDLSNNFMQGVIPAEIGTMSNLGTLFLQNNKFFGRVPPELNNALSISSIYPRSCKL